LKKIVLTATVHNFRKNSRTRSSKSVVPWTVLSSAMQTTYYHQIHVHVYISDPCVKRQCRWQFLVIFTYFDALDFIPAPCDVTTVIDPRQQNTLTSPLADLREFSPTFKPLIIYLNLVCNVIALTEYSDFHPC